MSRVLWLSDAGCTTGFGTVSHAIGDRLVSEYGHDVHCLAVNYKGDYWPTPMKLYVPTLKERMDVYGQSRFVEMLANVLPDVVVMVNDPYVVLRLLFRNRRDDQLTLARFAPILAYMPVDGTNFPEAWGRLPSIVSGLQPWSDLRPQPSLLPVVMSEFGHMLYPNAPLVYHGVDSRQFRKLSPDDPVTTSTGVVITSKEEARDVFGIPRDAKLVLRVDRNSTRKNYSDTYRALVPLMRADPSIHAWFHCKTEGDEVEVTQIVQRDLSIASRFHWPADFDTANGWSRDDLVALYNSADLFVSTSWSEGFGLTLAEAAACGLPIVAQNVSSIPEVVGPGGILLEPQRLIAGGQGQDQWLPDVDAFTDAIRQLLDDPDARDRLGAAGRRHVVASFSWDEATRRFHELITALDQKTSGASAAAIAGGAQ